MTLFGNLAAKSEGIIIDQVGIYLGSLLSQVAIPPFYLLITDILHIHLLYTVNYYTHHINALTHYKVGC